MAWNDIDFEWENTARSSLMTVTARIFVSKAKGKGPINILEEGKLCGLEEMVKTCLINIFSYTVRTKCCSACFW